MVSISAAVRQVKDDLPRLISLHLRDAMAGEQGFTWRRRLLNPLTLMLLFVTQVMCFAPHGIGIFCYRG